MSTQEQLDTIENLILSAAGETKVLNLLMFNGNRAELTEIGDLLGEAIEQVLALKKELGLTSTLSTVDTT